MRACPFRIPPFLRVWSDAWLWGAETPLPRLIPRRLLPDKLSWSYDVQIARPGIDAQSWILPPPLPR